MQARWLTESAKLWMPSSETLRKDELRTTKVIACTELTCAHGSEPRPLSTNDVNHCAKFICMHIGGHILKSIRNIGILLKSTGPTLI